MATARTAKRRGTRSGRERKRHGAGGKRWSGEVTRRSDALDLQEGVFKLAPREMARSLKRSAERSTRKKSSPFRSAMSMLTFFENRAGGSLSPSRRRAIDRAKAELRRLFGRAPARAPRRRP